MINVSVPVADDEFLDEVDSAAMDAIDEVKEKMMKAINDVLLYQSRPSVLYRPSLTKTATNWKATYGEFITFGSTPEKAMTNFDTQWFRRAISV